MVERGEKLMLFFGARRTLPFLFTFFGTGRLFYRLPFTVTMVERREKLMLFFGARRTLPFLFTFFGTGSLFYSFPLAPLMTFRNNDYGIFLGNFRFALFVCKIFMAPRTFPIFYISVLRTGNGFCGVIFQTMLVLGYVFISAYHTRIARMRGFVAHFVTVVFKADMPMVRFVAFPRFGKSMPACRDFFLFRLITYRTGVSLFAFFRASRLFGYNAAVPNVFGFVAHFVTVFFNADMPMVRFIACPRCGIGMRMRRLIIAAVTAVVSCTAVIVVAVVASNKPERAG